MVHGVIVKIAHDKLLISYANVSSDAIWCESRNALIKPESCLGYAYLLVPVAMLLSQEKLLMFKMYSTNSESTTAILLKFRSMKVWNVEKDHFQQLDYCEYGGSLKQQVLLKPCYRMGDLPPVQRLQPWKNISIMKLSRHPVEQTELMQFHVSQTYQ